MHKKKINNRVNKRISEKIVNIFGIIWAKVNRYLLNKKVIQFVIAIVVAFLVFKSSLFSVVADVTPSPNMVSSGGCQALMKQHQYKPTRTLTVDATAYGWDGNGSYGPVDSYGNKLKTGTIAVDPKVIPMKSKLCIEGYDNKQLPIPNGVMIGEALDTGIGWIIGNEIDIFVPVMEAEVNKFGRQRVTVYILEGGDGFVSSSADGGMVMSPFAPAQPTFSSADEDLLTSIGLTQDEINKWREMIEGFYDECGTLSIICKVKAAIKESTATGVIYAISGIRLLSFEPFKLIDPTGEETIISRYYSYFETFSWTLITCFLLWRCLKALATYVAYDDASGFKLLWPKLLMMSAMIATFPWIFKQLLTINSLIVKQMTDLSFLEDTVKSFSDLLSNSIVIFIVFIICVVLLLFVILVQQTIRLGELGLLFMLSPVAIASMMNEEFNIFPIWWKHLLSVIFTNAVQVTMLVISFQVASDTSQKNLSLIVTIGLLYMTYRSPALQKWLFSSGSAASTFTALTRITKTIYKRRKRMREMKKREGKTQKKRVYNRRNIRSKSAPV